MLNRILVWARRNTRRAAALAIAPGLVFLALDAWIEHFIANAGDEPLQWAPVYFGALGAVLLSVVALVRSRAAFAWIARGLGALGVIVGVTGTVVHLLPLLEDMDGTYDWPTLQGSLGVSPPVFAPLSFAGIGALVFLLASPKLLLRLRVGRVNPSGAKVLPLQSGDDSRRAI